MPDTDNPILAFLANSDPGRPPNFAKYVPRAQPIQHALAVALQPHAHARVLLVGRPAWARPLKFNY